MALPPGCVSIVSAGGDAQGLHPDEVALIVARRGTTEVPLAGVTDDGRLRLRTIDPTAARRIGLELNSTHVPVVRDE